MKTFKKKNEFEFFLKFLTNYANFRFRLSECYIQDKTLNWENDINLSRRKFQGRI